MGRRLSIINLYLAASACFIESAWPAPHATPCLPSRISEQWLENQTQQWRRQLDQFTGYEEPGRIEVCLTKIGYPHADYVSNRIWLRRLDAEENRRSLVHEYLHLAFKHSPRALNEVFIETIARQVLQGEL